MRQQQVERSEQDPGKDQGRAGAKCLKLDDPTAAGTASFYDGFDGDGIHTKTLAHELTAPLAESEFSQPEARQTKTK